MPRIRLKDYPTSIRLKGEVRDKLHVICKRQGCSLSWLISDVLRKWLMIQARKGVQFDEGQDAA